MESFDKYQMLPNELKCKIWKEVATTICENGVHHFKFTPDQPNRANQVLDVEPRLPNSDMSTWTERYDMKFEIDAPAFREISQWEKENRDQIWIAPFKPKKGAAYNRHGKVYVEKDMVVVHMSKEWTVFALLDLPRNQERFRGLKTVAIPYFGKPRWGRCLDENCPQSDANFCSTELGNFLCIFPNLTKIYLIYPLTANKIVQPRQSVGQLSLPGDKNAAKQVKVKAEVAIKEALAKIAAKGARVWRDKKKSYYEVIGKENRDLLVDCDTLVCTIVRMQLFWTTQRLQGRTAPDQRVVPGIVVCVDRAMEN